MVDCKLKVGFVFISRMLNSLYIQFFHLSSFFFGYRIQIPNHHIGSESQGKGVACAPVRTEDEVIRAEKGTGFFGVRQVAVGKDNDSHSRRLTMYD